MLRGIWSLVVLVVLTPLLSLPVTILVLLVPSWSNLVVHAGKIWSRAMLAAVGARVTYEGLDSLRACSPCIYLANHQSMIDIWVLLRAVPPATRFMAKQELFRIPVFGWVLSTTGFVPVNRTSHTGAMRSLELAARRIRDGCSVILFPEGSRSRDGRLRPFKKGAFHLALEAGVPVVPISITGSFAVMPPRLFQVKPGPVTVHVDAPIDVTRYQPGDTEGLLRDVYAMIERRVEPPPPSRSGQAVGLETS